MPMPTGVQAVPLSDPHWDQSDEGDEWHRCHFICLIIEGLKRAKVKPLNYSQVTVVQQGSVENPFTFLQCLKDAIQKHTTVDPESQVGEVLLKDKFLTQAAPDIWRQLQKSVTEGKKSLDHLMQVAMSVYYNWDLTKKEKVIEKTLPNCSSQGVPHSTS
jgi:hypothetical protein